MANDNKPEEKSKPNFFKKMNEMLGGESTGTNLITWIIAIIGIILSLLVGFLIYKKVTNNSINSFSETSASNIPSTLTGTPGDYSATSSATTTSI